MPPHKPIHIIPPGKTKIKPPRVVLYGPEKIGKSSIGSMFPDPIFIQTEDGISGLKVHKIPEEPCETWDELIDCCRVILKTDHDRKTLVLDTIDKAEALSQKWVLKNTHKGESSKYFHYFKGPIEAGEKMAELLHWLDRIRNEKNMNIVLLGHESLVKGANALGDEFLKWSCSLSKWGWPKVKNWADQIGHCTMEFRVVESKAKELSKDRQIVFGGNKNARDNGCRVGYEMPTKIPLKFDEYFKHMEGKLSC